MYSGEAASEVVGTRVRCYLATCYHRVRECGGSKSIPTEPVMKRLWLDQLGISDIEYETGGRGKRMKICACHFLEEFRDKTGSLRGALPVLNVPGPRKNAAKNEISLKPEPEREEVAAEEFKVDAFSETTGPCSSSPGADDDESQSIAGLPVIVPKPVSIPTLVSDLRPPASEVPGDIEPSGVPKNRPGVAMARLCCFPRCNHVLKPGTPLVHKEGSRIVCEAGVVPFPEDVEARREWLGRCKIPVFQWSVGMRLCPCHFVCSDGAFYFSLPVAVEARGPDRPIPDGNRKRQSCGTSSIELSAKRNPSPVNSSWHMPVDPDLTSLQGEPMDFGSYCDASFEPEEEEMEAEVGTEAEEFKVDFFSETSSSPPRAAAVDEDLPSIPGPPPEVAGRPLPASISALVSNLRPPAAPREAADARKPAICVRNLAQMTLPPSASLEEERAFTLPTVPRPYVRDVYRERVNAQEAERLQRSRSHLLATLQALRSRHACITELNSMLGQSTTRSTVSLGGTVNGAFFSLKMPASASDEVDCLTPVGPESESDDYDEEEGDRPPKRPMTVADLADDEARLVAKFPKSTIRALADVLAGADGVFVAVDSETEPKLGLEDEVAMTLVKLGRDESYPVMGFHWGVPRAKVEEIVEAVIRRMHSVLYAGLVAKARSATTSPEKRKKKKKTTTKDDGGRKRFEAVKCARIMLDCKNLNVWGDEKCDDSCDRRVYFSVAFGLASGDIFCRFVKLTAQENKGKGAVRKAADSLEDHGFRFLDLFPPETSLKSLNADLSSGNLLSSDMVAACKKHLKLILRLVKSFKILESEEKEFRDRSQMLWELCVGIVGARARFGWATEPEVGTEKKIKKNKKKKKIMK